MWSVILPKVFLTIATAVSFIVNLPQIYKTIKTKRSNDVSVLSYSISILECSCYVGYSFFVPDIWYKVACWSSAITYIIALIVILMFRQKQTKS